MSLIPVADLQTKHWLSCQSILNRFEAAWQRGVPPDLSAFVPQEEQIRLPVLFELILTDIEFRLRSGEEPRIESYLLQFPELNESDAFLVDLIVGECELRRSRESNFSQDEYLLRFPSHAAQVREKLATVSQRGSIVSTSRFSKLVYDNQKELQTSSLSIPGFEIISILGRGGMGVVFEARQIDLHRTVAIKVMRASMDDPSMSRRFFAEAEAVARLRHDNIVQVYSGGVHNNRAYLVMELARGQTLEESWNKNPPSSRQVAKTIRGLSSAIAYAHQQGIVHRDLKPSNILYDESGVARITDFGLAKALMSDESATVTGEILGTPAYMSPEQAVGESKNLGPSTDIYSLGAMLYQGLTGIPPFSGTSPMDTLAQIRWSQPMRPKELQPSSPFDLETICLKCLEKEPASRYANATELALDLQRFLDGQPIAARRTSLHEKAIKWCRRRPAIAAMSLLLMTICLFGAVLVGQQWRKATISLAKANERQRARLAGLVDSFLSASPESALNTLAEVRKEYASIPALLTDRERKTTGLEVTDNQYASQSQSEHASVAHRIDLVLLKTEPTRLLKMARIMVSTPPQEFLFLRAALEQLQNEIDPNFLEQLRSQLQSIIADPGQPQTERFHAALALSNASHSDGFAEHATLIVNQMLAMNPLEVKPYYDALSPLPEVIVEQLRSATHDLARPSEQRRMAMQLLAESRATYVAELVELLLNADDTQIDIVVQKLIPFRNDIVPKLWEIASDTIRAKQSHRDRDVQVLRISNAALALLALGEKKSAWSLFKSNERPDVQTALIHRLHLVTIHADDLLAQIIEEKDASIRQALLLAIAERANGLSQLRSNDSSIKALIKMYRSDPDAGVHGALRWLLFKLDKHRTLVQADLDLAKEGIVAGRNWYVTPMGHSMSIIRGPIEYTMGVDPATLPEDERLRMDSLRPVQIPRSWAIGQIEVSHPEYNRFKLIPRNTTYNPDFGGPEVGVNWYDAAQYCRWLAEQEHFAEDEMVYPEVDKIKPGLTLANNHLARTSYRLPSEAEWEYSARAGTVSRFYFGDSEQFGMHYAWTLRVADHQVHRSALLKPNRLGLFDCYGNVSEWCQECTRFGPNYSKSFLDIEDLFAIVKTLPRSLRGGSMSQELSTCRSSMRNLDLPVSQFFNAGFRIARTLN